MITHGSEYKLLKKLELLEEPCSGLKTEDALMLLRQEIQRKAKQAYERNRNQYNLRAKPISYQIGQEIYRRNFAKSNFSQNFNAKLSPAFLKARIREKVGNNYYLLEDLGGKLIGTYHAKDIRP